MQSFRGGAVAMRNSATLLLGLLLSASSAGMCRAEAGKEPPCAGDVGDRPTVLVGPVVDLNDGSAEGPPNGPQDHQDHTANSMAEAVFDVLNLDDQLSASYGADELPDTANGKVLSDRIREAILNGADSAGHPFEVRRTLLSELRNLGCEYLVGWTRSGEARQVVRTLVFDVNSGGVFVPFPSSVFSSTQSPKHVGKLLGARLDMFFAEQVDRQRRLPRSKVFMGCFSPQDSNSRESNRAQAALRDAAAQVVTEIATDPKFSNLALPLICAGSAPVEQQPVDLWIGGNVQSDDRGFSVRLVIALGKRTQVPLQLSTYEWANASDVTVMLMQEARSVILVFSDVSSWNEISDGAAGKAIPDAVADIESAVRRGAVKAGMAKAYALIGAKEAPAEAVAAGRYELGGGFVEMKEFTLAAWQLNRALDNEGKNLSANLLPLAYEKLGRAYAGLNDTNSAIKNYQIALGYVSQKDKEDKVAESRIRNLMSDVRLSNGDFNRAASNLIQAPNRASDPLTEYKFAKVKELQGDLAAAAQFYREAIRLDGGLAPATSALARVLAKTGEDAVGKGDWKTASDALSEALKYDGNDVRSRYLLAFTKSKLNKPEDAITEYTQILSSHDSRASQFVESSFLNLIEQEILAAQYDGAITTAKQATETAFAQVHDSRLLTKYLWFVAAALKDSGASVDALRYSDEFRNWQEDKDNFQKNSAGRLSLNWDNEPLQRYYSTVLNPDRKQFVDNVTQSVFGQ